MFLGSGDSSLLFGRLPINLNFSPQGLDPYGSTIRTVKLGLRKLDEVDPKIKELMRLFYIKIAQFFSI